MFLVKAGTVIQVKAPKSETHHYWSAWVPYTTKDDKLYDKHEVMDMVAVLNHRDMPDWAYYNITEFNKVILCRDGKYALVNSSDITFLD